MEPSFLDPIPLPHPTPPIIIHRSRDFDQRGKYKRSRKSSSLLKLARKVCGYNFPAMEAASDGGPSSPTPPEAAVVDVKNFTNYLRRIVPLLLEGDPEIPLELDTSLKESLHVDYIRKFLADAQTRCLLVQRTPLKDEEEGDETSSTESGSENEREKAIYTIALDVHYTAPKLSSVAFIKRGAIVDADKKITSQIRVINLNEGSPYETLHSYISNAMAPYFKSFVRKSGKADR